MTSSVKLTGAGVLTLLVALLLRWCLSVHSYSGENKPPMYGDYEAQRHWMEITYNLPAQEWYFNSSDNDLMYWGLDYPPLTAYHSKLCGSIAALFNESFVALALSRGYESYLHKLFMRTTVIVSDLLILFPAVWIYFSVSLKLHESPIKWIFLVLTYPGLILVDHGHFQYNGVSLGFTIGAVAAIWTAKDLLSSVLFTLAISYKQMSLYHALPFFFYLLGKSFHNGLQQGFSRVFVIGMVVLSTFLIVWFPFVADLYQLKQVLHRLFPVARGVFEDKVSNFWCSLNVFYKLKNIFSHEEMAIICIVLTLVTVMPSSFDLLLRPQRKKFVLALINSSLSFFLFSFQVHEKSILLAAVPTALYFPDDPFICMWFLAISSFSMLPLLVKDGLFIPTVALTVFHIIVTALMTDIFSSLVVNSKGMKNNNINVWKKTLFFISMTGCAVLSCFSVLLSPPSRFPDLFPLLVSVYSFAHFFSFFLYFNVKQVMDLPFVLSHKE